MSRPPDSHSEEPGARHSAEEVVEHVEIPTAPTPKRGTLMAAALVGGTTVAVLFAIGVVPRLGKTRSLRERAQEVASAVPRVQVVHPKRATAARTAVLPGNIDPLRETLVYARATGYVREWKVDIGDSVTAGQLLLELDTPEVDQELAQARAALAQTETAVDQAKAHRELSKVTAARYEKLGPSGVASQQDVEERRTQLTVDDANVHAAEAAVASAKANVNRLIELKAFSHVTAPFAGRITARNVELGQLVNAGSAGGPGLFTLAQVDPLRVFVHVPQDFATSVKAGQKVSVGVREFPDRDFPGTVTRTAGALDAASRTLLVEVQLPSQGVLLAGMYAQVTLDLSEPRPVLRLPSTALQLGAHGPRVALVDEKHKLHFQPVQVGEDHGTEVEIVNGLSEQDQVVLFVPAGVADDTQVEVMEPKRT
jgi:RND family efflux transporter MFP subunit